MQENTKTMIGGLMIGFIVGWWLGLFWSAWLRGVFDVL